MSRYNNVSNQDLNTNILKYIIPKLNNTSDTLTDNFCVAATLSFDYTAETITSQFVYSYDSITWQEADSGSELLTVCNSISYNGLIYIAGGFNADGGSGLAYSADGKNWFPVYCSPFEDGQCCDIMWANGRWFACGSTEVSGLSTQINARALKNKVKSNKVDARGVIIPSNGNGIIASSNDGKHWCVEYESCSVSVFTCLAYSGILYMVGGDNYRIKWSKDGNCWHTVCGDKPEVTTSLSYNNKMWVAAGTTYNDETDNNECIVSYSYCGTEDWNTTSPLSYFENKLVNKLLWNGYIWVMVAYPYFLDSDYIGGIQIAYSTNGHCWNAVSNTSGLINMVNSLTWNGTTWIAGGADISYPTNPDELPTFSPVFIYSIDGINWQKNTREILSGNSLTGNFAIFAMESRNIVHYQRTVHSLSLNEVAYWIAELFDYTVPAVSNDKITALLAKPHPGPSSDADDSNLENNKPSTVHIVPDDAPAPAPVPAPEPPK